MSGWRCRGVLPKIVHQQNGRANIWRACPNFDLRRQKNDLHGCFSGFLSFGCFRLPSEFNSIVNWHNSICDALFSVDFNGL